MGKRIVLFVVIAFYIWIGFTSINNATPARNGTQPGCSGENCHVQKVGNVTYTIVDSVTIEVNVVDSKSGKAVSGELINSAKAVVTTVNKTKANPFRIVAPEPGVYLLNAGNRSPSNSWDSVTVDTRNLSSVDNSSINEGNNILYQNYPNPFDTYTSIKFYMDNPGKVKLTVYDIKGNEIKVLVDSFLAGGNHEYKLDCSGLAKGMYSYCLKIGNNRLLSKKFILK